MCTTEINCSSKCYKELPATSMKAPCVDWTAGSKICKVFGTQLLPEPAPHFLDRVEIRGPGRHLPQCDVVAPVHCAASTLTKKAFIITQNRPWTSLLLRIGLS